jgi:aspartate/tyrosine/aromatic aminotransferase
LYSKRGEWAHPKPGGRPVIDYILRDIGVKLWAQAKQKATLKRKSMREVLFDRLKWYVTASEIPASPQKKKGEKKG